MALVIIPILIPINYTGGNNVEANVAGTGRNVTRGLDTLTISNVQIRQANRLWAHCILSVMVVAWVIYNFYDELRRYLRIRQAYLTSPQHRLRASATTVLVRSIPPKWNTVEALEGLFDVFPGGLRNVWINRNYDELNEKVIQRDKLAGALEAAETELVKKCRKAHLDSEKKNTGKDKKKGIHSKRNHSKIGPAASGARNTWIDGAGTEGISANNPHQVHHSVEDAVNDGAEEYSSEGEEVTEKTRIFGRGLEAVTHGFDAVGKTVLGGLHLGGKDAAHRGDAAQTGRSHADNTAHQDIPESSEERGRLKPITLPLWKPSGGRQKPSPLSRSQEDDQQHPPSEGSPSTLQGTMESVGSKHGSNSVENDADPADKHSMKKKLSKEVAAYDPTYDNDQGVEPLWKKYIKESDRETMRLPIFGWTWMPSIPLIGKKVDTIYYCRKEVARLNAEIEKDQAEPDKFPLMNSAFIQFNNQAAAHMACQSVSHHLPKQMQPRLVEISPNDVIWDNMSIPWWQQYVRTAAVITAVAAMIVLWAIPVAFSGSLSQIDTIRDDFPWLANWLGTAPGWVISIIQGILPVAIIGILVALLPLILRFLVKLQGVPTGMLIELAVQRYYFAFQFVQIFLVVSISSAISTLVTLIEQATQSSFNVSSVPELLAQNIPQSSNYFLSYLLLQALSVSSGALAQIVNIVSLWVFGPLFDNTARSKFRRQTQLQQINWGTFFPVYTNLACIGLIYSVISPLILIFNVITFSLFWVVYRYNTLYVNQFKLDTGGLLFPRAVNQLFTGLYVLELVLIGYFIIVETSDLSPSFVGPVVIMVITFLATVLFQILINDAFSPLFRYLPITLEDDAVERDKEFAKLLAQRHHVEDEPPMLAGRAMEETDTKDRRQSVDEVLEQQERHSQEEDREADETDAVEMQKTRGHGRTGMMSKLNPINLVSDTAKPRKGSWANRDPNRRSASFGRNRASSPSVSPQRLHRAGTLHRPPALTPALRKVAVQPLEFIAGRPEDIEAQRSAQNKLNEAIFAGLHDELEDLTPEQRDVLVQRAFLHSALRAKRPVIWIPRDALGVSDDEIQTTAKLSKFIWISNQKQGLDEKGRCTFMGAPPDFDEVDLIQL